MRKGEGYFVGQVLALCPGWWQSPHSLARFAGGSSVGGLVVEVREAGEGEGVREGGWESEISGSLGSGQVMSFKLSGQKSLILL